MKLFKFDIHWDVIKAQLKQRYAQLTDDDLAYAEGKGAEVLARIRAKINAPVDDLTALLGDLHESAESAWENMKTTAGEFGAGAKAQTVAAYDQTCDGVTSMTKSAEQCIRQHPRKSLLGAVCVGLVVGMWIRR